MEDYLQQRRQRLLSKLAEEKIDNLLVTDLTNIRYLTGFTGSSATLLISASDVVIVSDGRYQQQLIQQCADIESVIHAIGVPLAAATAELMRERFVGGFHFEQSTISLANYRAIEREFPRPLVASSQLCEQLREIKDAVEIENIRRSIDLNQQVYQQVTGSVRRDMTERELAAEIEYRGRRLGADGCSFEPIVAVGSNSALAHHRPGDRKIGDSPFTLIDWGLNYQGYASDLTRILVTSKIPAQFEEIYSVTLTAQLAAIAAIAPGCSTKRIDQIARDIIADAGLGDRFNHSLGHGIGLKIHEGPRLSQACDGELQSGMVVTVEPGIYIPEFGGVRIEDDVLVTENGHEVISNLTKQLNQCVVPV